MNDLAVLPAPAAVDRRRFIGGSDVAAVLGVSPWTTPVELYFKKIGEGAPEDPSKAAIYRRGHRWEPVALDMLLDELEVRCGERPIVVARNQRYVDSRFDYLACEIDAEIILPGDGDEITNVEIKTVHAFKAHEWGEMDSDEVPIHYAAQAMHGLAITGRKRTIVGALFGADKMTPYSIRRDDETIVAIREKCVQFWTQHVLARVPPEPVALTDLTRLLLRSNGHPVETTAEVAEAVERLRVLRAAMKANEQQEQDLIFEIGMAFRAAFEITDEKQDVPVDDPILTLGGKPVCSWKRQRGASLDQKRLAIEKPEVVAAFTREYHFRVMRPKAAK